MEFETKNHEPGRHDKIGTRGEKEHPLGQPSKRQLHQGGCCQATGPGLGQVKVEKTTASRSGPGDVLPGKTITYLCQTGFGK